MSKDKKIIPQLRFPEFVNEGEWVNDILFNLAFNGFSNGVFNDPNKVGSGYRLINVINMYTESTIKDNDLSLLELSSSEFEKNKVEHGDIFFTRSSLVTEGIAKSNIYLGMSDDITYDGHLIRMRPKKELIDPVYLHYLLKTSHVRSQMISRGKTATMTTIGQSDIASVKVSYSSNPKEQQKIASCFTSLDEVIAAQSQKLELLKDHKKGLMQNLFPQEGEKVPKYRFKEFINDGEWVVKPLDDICKLVRGPFGGALKKEIFVKDGYAVYEQSHAIYSDFSSFRYFIDEEKFKELKRFSVKVGDLIMSCSGTMGKFAVIPESYKVGVINQALLKLTIKMGYDKQFVKMTLEAENNQNKLLSQSAGGAIKNVVEVSQIKEIKLSIPDLNEQKKIASCLTSLEDLITAQTDKVEELKLHKKGLMQGLFPKMID
ncbi:MAG: restriction endonuclease subunit S [Ignavibacteria bacterium]|nr:restriction endonuclease subunit S [Ignavibacteria bacterium]